MTPEDEGLERRALGGGLPNDREEFDEATYLEINLDVAQEVAAGTYNSGREHWDRHGRSEGRAATRPKDFDELLYLDLNPDVLLNEESAVQPRAAYAVSKLAGERELLALYDADFSPVMLRMGTLFGFSPRMRYDLVVNTFVKDVFLKGAITLHYGGQMWRPLVDVRDAARAYVIALEAPDAVISGQIFNVVAGNYRISELALHVREGLRQKGVNVEINSQFQYSGIRNYRVSGKKISQVLNYKPVISVEESVKDMVEKIRDHGYTDFDNDRYYNLRWMKLLEQVKQTIDITGTIFDMPSEKAVLELAAGGRGRRASA